MRDCVSAAAGDSGVKEETYMKDLANKMAVYLTNSRSENTVKCYFYGFKRWETFIKTHGFKALPAQPIHVALYLTHLLDTGASCNSINTAVYSIKWVHHLNNFIDPTDNSFVSSLQEAGKRTACGKKCKKDPVTSELLIQLCEHFQDCNDLLIIRDLTMILLSFAGFLRYDEISSLVCKNVKVFDQYLLLYIEKAKTDQYRNGNEVLIAKGHTVACPFSMFQRYLVVSKVSLDSDYFLFRPVFRSNNVCKLIYKNKKLSYTAARQSIISKLKLFAKDLDLGLHSMRSGGATAVANSDVNERCWKRHGRWSSDSSKDLYVVDSVEKRLEVSKHLGL